jgi:AcrR family transcriptional regulator
VRRQRADRPSLTREDWVDAATGVLVDEGIDHVRVDVLAQQLEVTRGSFYWHFRDREELLRGVLQRWRETATENLTARLESAHADPREQLRDVISLPFRGRAAVRAARIELAIRAWARRDALARQARGRGRREPHRLHRADVLVDGLCGDGGALARLPRCTATTWASRSWPRRAARRRSRNARASWRS